jgi:hypothetical protein
MAKRREIKMNEENSCERVNGIKYGIIAQILSGGIDLAEYRSKCRNEKGELSKEKEIELADRYEILLDTYSELVDLVWEGSLCGCDECQIDQNKTDSDVLSDELKKKLKPDYNPN